jgi:alpha-beta hydrolase superfamily lysophospholipase
MQMIWQPDVLDGFEQTVIARPEAPDGPVEIVLVRRARSTVAGTSGVLYVHGFGDYFFQGHLAGFYEARGIKFYAVDLRRHGRALGEHQLPNFVADIDELVGDISAAVDAVTAGEGVEWLLLNGHSTGGLAASLFAHRGVSRDRITALFLNSPFLDMNLPRWQAVLVEPMVAAAGRVWPRLKLPGVSSTYGESIHADHHGEWRFDERWKPVLGFGARAGWFRAMHRAHAEVASGLSIDVPVLVLHAERSLRVRRWTEGCQRADIVLDVRDMQRVAPRLGRRVTVQAVPDAIHDLSLSTLPARTRTFELVSAWLTEIRAG